MPRDDSTIYFDREENARRLRECAGPHVFYPLPWRENVFRDQVRFRCNRCGGELDAPEVCWYANGLEHGVLISGKKIEAAFRQ